ITVAAATADGKPAKITATDGHPFWLPDLKEWSEAGALHPGQWLRTSSGTWTQITAIAHRTQSTAVYNLTVDDLHTYYALAGATPVLVHNCGTGRASSYFSAYPRQFLDQAAKYGKAGVRQLSDGRVRFYGEVAKARTPGEMVGRRLVREWNPDTGATRIWHETLDHAGKVRIVRPDVTATGGKKVHYLFDSAGNYTGSF
ncbi:polymorphic toxin-type HINT domain-containing protein, partial [Streptomyces scopuliridis]|uniref:polymorphic toxin-type HINT domain-containing protein n=1 Tax=Streptomyces scopuliridis TaxID=452529 RepID=UPI0036BC7384